MERCVCYWCSVLLMHHHSCFTCSRHMHDEFNVWNTITVQGYLVYGFDVILYYTIICITPLWTKEYCMWCMTQSRLCTTCYLQPVVSAPHDFVIDPRSTPQSTNSKSPFDQRTRVAICNYIFYWILSCLSSNRSVWASGDAKWQQSSCDKDTNLSCNRSASNDLSILANRRQQVTQ